MLTCGLMATALIAAASEQALPDRQAALGRLLFFDPTLSEPIGQACASCHDPATAFADPDTTKPTSKGVHRERFGNRNTPSAMYMAFSPPFHFDKTEEHYVGGQFWDGRAATLEEQAKGPFVNPLEMANPNQRAVVEKVRRTAYATQFDDIYGPGALAAVEPAFERIAAAIAAYERTAELAPFSSKYDAFLQGRARLAPQELRGLQLFNDEKKGNCAACHPNQRQPNGDLPLFTDFTYDNIGVPRNPDNPFYRQSKTHNPQGRKFVDKGLGGFVKQRAEDGKFKVPTLRNIALTAPYMHNGYFKTLRGTVAFYNDRDVRPACKGGDLSEAGALRRGCWPRPEIVRNLNKDEMGRLGLTNQEIDDIVAFMLTLTDGYAP
ncbi:MAG: cytochrome-c peroxidase [Gammaproteobacteria bacterium]|nr:cytochrome-c peroxidase [Rhodocyclaceae bacterium]MBU3909440.1 cytochrome-c peroxidase [Gammaproteobacteria bacterium]MBU3988600.1 cytochrome-c peroxidase [Gammaproteobacteria bacterium]MBU4003618.1 cytochrome-c peroxidase [Gammaproteobacteria bacterium]MBU4021976.1 cytochrome-c peroxidase [Gammaproteobacteria bacterium]